MSKNSEELLINYVKKQTFFGAVVLSLVLGFVGGTIYSSFKLTPQKVNVQQNSGSAPAQMQNDNSAQFGAKIMQMEQFLKDNPKDAEAWTQLGNLFFDSDQYANSIEAYGKSLALKPGNTSVLTDMGVMYRRNKQPQKAIETFDKVIQIDPNFETARFNKGVVLLHDLNDFEGGIKAWEELVRQNPMALAPNGESVDSIVRKMKAKNKNQ